MNREKRSAPKPKRFCTSSDETLSRRKNRPRMVDALTKIKLDLTKRSKKTNNLAQVQLTSNINSIGNFKREKFRQTSKTDVINNSERRHSFGTDITDNSGHVSKADTLDRPRHTSGTDKMGYSTQPATQVRSPSNFQTALDTSQRDDTNSSIFLKRQTPHVRTPTSSQTTTRHLNSQSDVQPPQYDQTHSNTFNPNIHCTIESQHSPTIIPESFHEQYAQPCILLSPSQKRPRSHSMIPSHAQASSTKLEELHLQILK